MNEAKVEGRIFMFVFTYLCVPPNTSFNHDARHRGFVLIVADCHSPENQMIKPKTRTKVEE